MASASGLSEVRVGYFPTKHIPGISSLDPVTWSEGVATCIVGTLTEVLNAEHHTDAHMVLYSVQEEDEWPRLKKSCLPHLEAAGRNVEISLIVLDYDNPGHAAWTVEEQVGFFDMLQSLADQGWPLALLWSAIYTTRGGARFIYVCDEPMTPREYERKVRTIIKEFHKVGIGVDDAVTDWTRMFRLPDVVRDGERQGIQPWFLLREQDELLPIADIPEADPSELTNQWQEDRGTVEETNDPQPPEDEVLELLESATAGKPTEWCKWAKLQLKGREYFDALFNEKPLAEEGARNEALFEAASSVIGLLYGRNNTTREHCYSLLLSPTLKFEPDADTPDWTAALWSMVQRIWAKEEAKAKVRVKEEKDREQQALSIVNRMALGAKEWAEDKVQLKDDEQQPVTEQAIKWLDSHAIACPPTAKEFYVMQPDGLYYPMPFSRTALVSGIRRILGFDVLPTLVTSQQGNVSDRNIQEIINAHTTVVNEVIYEPGDSIGGFIRKPDTPQAQLVISPFMRNPELTPRYDLHVDTWLQKFFGENFEEARRWIAWSLAWEEGAICALSLSGPSGSGKTMLAEGLKECLAVPAASSFAELTGDWQYGLAQSPFVVADEGFDELFKKGHPADVFRRIIGQHSLNVNRKMLSPVKINTNCRVLFTANNHSLIHALVGNKDITPEDRDALLVRLMHFDLDDEATVWLAMNGGRQFTDRWISDGHKSDYVIARHFLHLYEQRADFGRDDRLLVEGNMSEAIMNELRLHSGTMDRVVEAIVRMAELKLNDKRRGSTKVADNQLYMLPSDVHEFVTTEMGYKNIRIGTVQTVMRNLLPTNAVRDGSQPPITIEGDRRRWYLMDLSFLISVCKTYGWRSNTLEDILAGSYNPEGQYMPSIRPKDQNDAREQQIQPRFNLPDLRNRA